MREPPGKKLNLLPQPLGRELETGYQRSMDGVPHGPQEHFTALLLCLWGQGASDRTCDGEVSLEDKVWVLMVPGTPRLLLLAGPGKSDFSRLAKRLAGVGTGL